MIFLRISYDVQWCNNVLVKEAAQTVSLIRQS